MALAIDLITRSLRMIGSLASGESAPANDALEAFDDLNDLLDQWSLEDLMLFYDKTEEFPLVPGQIEYSIGPTGADFTTVRPIEILLANYRTDADTDIAIDLPMQVIAHDTYERLVQKITQQTVPGVLAYKPTFPNGTILIWPTPGDNFSLRILTNNLFTRFTNLTDSVDLPPGYNEAILYGLSERLCIRFGRKEMLAEITERAIQAKLNIKRKNKKINLMYFDPALNGRRSRDSYNVYTDT